LHKAQKKAVTFTSGDLRNDLRTGMSRILEILLLDRTTSRPGSPKNIIWANDNYQQYDPVAYGATAQITPELITGSRGSLILPRAMKTKALQKERTKTKAEVFTPTWIVKKQNDTVDENFTSDDLETYTHRKWLEIACGEAPYMATRYDMETGELIPIAERVGFVDRKLARINNEITDKDEWQRLVELAYKSSYGFEWSGDSLLIARENLLFTYRDYYLAKWGREPQYGAFEKIATIISYNIFQMDGLKFIIPLTEKMEKVKVTHAPLFDADELVDKGWGMQQPLFGIDDFHEEWRTIPGRQAEIMNWDTNGMDVFAWEIPRI